MAEFKKGQLCSAWSSVLGPQFELPYMQALKAFLLDQKQAGKVLYPPSELMFNALNSTPFDAVKVVILGQDPYHGPGQAHGLSFSVPGGVKIPPSLRNIYSELVADVGITPPDHGCLQSWADQGVLLLNSVLSVEQANAGSHQGQGWERFTDSIIQAINEQRESVVFLLWGSYAQKKGQLIDRQRHLVLQAPHPSPLSAHRGFLGCRHFSQTNDYLTRMGSAPINWQV